MTPTAYLKRVHGHLLVTADDVARATGLTRGAVYHHLRSLAAREQARVVREEPSAGRGRASLLWEAA